MINKIKHFFTRKRCRKLLKNNKGFSLLEVLAAVTIIGLLSAIAIPQFQDYKEGVAFTVASTSTSSIARAYNTCVAFKDFTDCSTLEDIKISCPGGECADKNGTRTSAPFCAEYEKDISGTNFKLCVSIDGDGQVSRTAGGNFSICHKTCATAGCTASDRGVISPIKRCDAVAECNSVKPADTGSGATLKTFGVTCPAQPVTNGTCNLTSGACT